MTKPLSTDGATTFREHSNLCSLYLPSLAFASCQGRSPIKGNLEGLSPLSVVQEFLKLMITFTVCAEHSFVAGGRWKEPWWLWQGGEVSRLLLWIQKNEERNFLVTASN